MKDEKYRVLVVDDDRDILDLLKYNLEKIGYRVKTIENSDKAIAAAKKFSPDLIILDIMMPHPNGIELCRELRSLKQFEQTYIFFLTAKSESYYQEAALDTGGDDYIEKIVGLRALTHKVGTVLKEHFVIRKSLRELTIGKLLINRKTHLVRVGSQEVSLSQPEFELLFFFAQNPRKIITLENLLHNLWGSEIYLLDTSIEVYMESLMKKIGYHLIHRMDGNRFRFDVH